MSQETLEALFQNARHSIGEALETLRADVARELETPQSKAAVEEPEGGPLVNAARVFAAAGTQVALLNGLADACAQLAPRVILFIRKGQNLHGWAGRGFDQEFLDDQLKKVNWDIESFAELQIAIQQKETLVSNFSELGEISKEIERFGGYVPFKACFYPILVKVKAAALLYVDSGSETQLSQVDALETLAYMAGLELTLITSKLKTAKPKPASSPKPKPAFTEEETPPSADSPGEGARSIVPPTAIGPSGATTVVAGAVEEEDPAVKKAKRVARVLVSDLKLYNEEAVSAGRANGDLYGRLKEDLDRSFQHYRERIDGLELKTNANYFKEELVRQLADGDESALGPLPF